VLNRLKDVSVGTGDVAVFTCRVCGRPKPNIVWTGPDQTQISNSAQTLCDYFDDGLARLQVSVPVYLTSCSILLLSVIVTTVQKLPCKQFCLPDRMILFGWL